MSDVYILQDILSFLARKLQKQSQRRKYPTAIEFMPDFSASRPPIWQANGSGTYVSTDSYGPASKRRPYHELLMHRIVKQPVILSLIDSCGFQLGVTSGGLTALLGQPFMSRAKTAQPVRSGFAQIEIAIDTKESPTSFAAGASRLVLAL